MGQCYRLFSPLNSERTTLSNSSSLNLNKILDLNFADKGKWERTHFSLIVKLKRPNKWLRKRSLALPFSFLSYCVYIIAREEEVEKKIQ